MKTTIKMLLSALGIAAFVGYLLLDSARPAPDEDLLNTDQTEYERVVVIAIDLSDSFLDEMADEGKGWLFLMKVLDRYLRGNGNEKLILVQLSGNEDAVIWDGTPAQLRKDFPNREEFRRFLHSKADRNASRLHDGITDALHYLKRVRGVTPKTKRVVLILSDMIDNQSASNSEQRLIDALTEFGKQGGVAGMYLVDRKLKLDEHWEPILKRCLKHSVVVSTIQAPIPMPAID